MTTLTLDPGVEEFIDPLGDIDWKITPAHCGPTWDLDPNWDGPRDPDGYVLPKLTLGWQVIDWIEANLIADEADDYGNPIPFKLTNEQMRFILWFYAIDENGTFLYREVVLQRLKGWGKDPLAACIAAVEFVGPCRFAGWATKDLPHLGLEEGDPVAKSHPRAWVQIAAVSREQTKNTMMIFAGIFSEQCKSDHGIDIGKEVVYAYGGQRRIESVTSSPRSLEGNRPTLVIKNETHHWRHNNDGHDMADAIERNATKAKGGAARTLSITNAYEPSEDSVAQRERESWEMEQSGLAMSSGTLYDSLEAPPTARLRPWKTIPEDMEPDEVVRLTIKYLSRVLEAVRGGAWWLDIPSLTQSILNPKNPPSRSRRFWYNQIVTSEDAWADPDAIKAAIDATVDALRMDSPRTSRVMLECGWVSVRSSDEIVMFFDGSKSDDATALVGCRLSDGYVFTIGVWQKPSKKRAKDWLAPRAAIDIRVREAFARFNVVAFWADPSHAKDDSDGTRYWDGLIDEWMRDFTDEAFCSKIDRIPLDKHHWPVKSGHGAHAIMFDMTSRERNGMFVAAAESFITDLEALNDIEEFVPRFKICGHPAMVQHLKNARRFPTEHGISLMKEGRESDHKIDLAVCAVGARMLRRIVLNVGVEKQEAAGEIWGS